MGNEPFGRKTYAPEALIKKHSLQSENIFKLYGLAPHVNIPQS